MSSVETVGLTRRFGPLVAVDGLDLSVPASGVVGLVGPNGSGKSTLIRMLLGLIRPSSGHATVLGEPITQPTAYAARVGALVESPAFVPGLSARANLSVLARLRGLPAARIDEVLQVVGLTGRDTEPVKRFSLGMKQRLGIAAALLPDPQLLILDEPTNGLDPAGIVEIRGLLQRIGESGRTVIVSSHLLSEIESICTYLVVIRFGVLVYAGPIADLMGQTVGHIDVRSEFDRDSQDLQRALAAAGWDVRGSEGGLLQVAADPGQAAQINRDATSAGFTLQSLTARRGSLEEIFLAMTGPSDGDAAAARAAALSNSQITEAGRR